ncbi:MAG: mechanosensitive ion channel family protein [Spongiibacteraceae bacterium]
MDKLSEYSFDLTQQWPNLLRVAALLLLCFIALRIYRHLVVGRLLLHLGAGQGKLVQRIGTVAILLVFISAAMNELGFKLSVLLGAAGVLSVAVGFAAQTSAANLISGWFVMGERSFLVGDVIDVSGFMGEVLSIDTLSVKLRTFDNRFVRIPNETIIKSNVINLSRVPIRRFDLQIGIAYQASIAKARAVIARVVDEHPMCLEEPRPQIVMKGFGESTVNLQLMVWAARENFGDMSDSIQEQIKLAFDAEGIEFPFAQRTLSLAADNPPLRVVIDDSPTRQSATALPATASAPPAELPAPDLPATDPAAPKTPEDRHRP